MKFKKRNFRTMKTMKTRTDYTLNVISNPCILFNQYLNVLMLNVK